MVPDDMAAWCALNLTFGFEPLKGHALVRALGDPAAAFRLSRNRAREILGPSKYLEALTPRTLEQARDSLEGLLRSGYRFIGYGDPDYPALLRECDDPPLGLYLRSTSAPPEIFRPDRPAVAIVGTRDISPYGTEWCQRIVTTLARTPEKPLIVSGLAIGTDGIAHRTALEQGLPTVGVMATGIDDVYPFRHGALAARMARTPGCGLVTDYPPGTAPLAVHFLRRNRIIAGLCRAVILVESKVRGGGMMTARLAASYDRDVLVLPGRADDLRSQGCNLLLREKLAEPVTDLDTLPAQLGLGAAPRQRPRDLPAEIHASYDGRLPAERVERLAELAACIRARRGIGLDALCRETGRTYGEVAADTGILAADGFICMDLLQNCTIKPKNM